MAFLPPDDSLPLTTPVRIPYGVGPYAIYPTFTSTSYTVFRSLLEYIKTVERDSPSHYHVFYQELERMFPDLEPYARRLVEDSFANTYDTAVIFHLRARDTMTLFKMVDRFFRLGRVELARRPNDYKPDGHLLDNIVSSENFISIA